MEPIRDKDGRVLSMVLFESEMCEYLNVAAEDLRSYEKLIAPTGTKVHPEREREERIFNVTREQLEVYARYAKILGTGMTVEQVKELQQQDDAAAKAGKKAMFVDTYAVLAEECPPGITAHALRSYSALLVHQRRRGVMMLPKDLARAANISEETAKRHIQFLMAMHHPETSSPLLRMEENPDRWEFAFVPRALTRYYRH
jgi:hypothetical protein